MTLRELGTHEALLHTKSLNPTGPSVVTALLQGEATVGTLAQKDEQISPETGAR
jgi:hypothetical protein